MYLDYRESEAAAPVDIARTFIEARDAWDAEATAALFAPDAVINDLQVPLVADYPEQYRWHETVDWRWTAQECAEVADPPRTVACFYTMENAWLRALEVDPITGGFVFIIVTERSWN